MHNKNKYTKELKVILDIIDEDIANLSEEEIDSEIKKSGEQPENIVKRMRIAKEEGLNAFKISKLDKAREKRLEIEPSKESITEKISKYSREELIKGFSLFPKAEYAFRDQNKKIDTMDTEDLRALLEGLSLAEELKKTNDD